MGKENHYINRSGWLRAAVLGANDGIISTSSLAIGVAAASTSRDPVVLATIAGIVAGAMSMAAGEYVSVSSQSDLEANDLAREELELNTMPESELNELAVIYENRGLDKLLSREVAKQLMARNALEAHARDELNINDITKAKPWQAAFSSAISFITGGIFPLAVTLIAPVKYMVFYQYGFSIIFLAFSGFLAARFGGSGIGKSIWRICFWGSIAMLMSAIVGYLFKIKS